MLPRALLSVLVTAILVPNLQSQTAAGSAAALTDHLGDPLPDGAIARLGTVRFKHTPSRSATVDTVIYSPDGSKIASFAFGSGSLRLWDASSGKEIAGPWAADTRYSAVAFTPDSGWLAVAIYTGDGSKVNPNEKRPQNGILLYDIASKGTKDTPLKTIPGPNQLVRAMAFADGGKTLVAAGDGVVRWWDLNSGKEIRTWRPLDEEQAKTDDKNASSTKTFTNCALSSDAKSIALQIDVRNLDEGRRIIRRFSDAKVVVQLAGYDLASGKKTWHRSGEGSRVAGGQFAYSADGKRIAIYVGSDKVELRNTATGKLEMSPLEIKSLANGRPGGLALSADGRILAVASGDSHISLHNTVELGSPPRKFMGRMAHNLPNSTACLSFSPRDDKLLVAVDADLQVYDTQTLGEVAGSDGHRGWVNQLTFTPDGAQLITGLSGRGQESPIYFRPDGQMLYLGTSGTRGGLPLLEQAVWDVATGKRLQLASTRTPPWPNFGPMSLPQSVYVGNSGEDSLRLFDIKSGKSVARMFAADKQAASGVGYFSPSGKHFVHYLNLNQPNAAERIYAVPSGKLACTLAAVAGNPNQYNFLSQTPTDPSENLAFSPDEKLVAQFGRGDGMIRVYDTATGKLRHSLGEKIEVEPNRPGLNVNYDVAFSADGRWMASWTSIENSVHIWDMGVGVDLISVPSDDPLTRLKLAWSADGRILAIGGSKVRFLELATLGVRRELKGHPDAMVRAMAFAPGSRLLATSGSDTTVLLWDLLKSSNAPQSNAPLDRAGLEARWQILAKDDAGTAFTAMLQLMNSPRESIPWIKERVAVEVPIDPKKIEGLVESLNDKKFKVRENASAELLQIGSRALPAIDKALENKPSLETIRRLQSIRTSATSPVLKGEKLQAHRAIESLEKIGTPEAREVLRALADGADGGLITTQSRNALARLQR